MFLASSEPFTSCLVFWETNGKERKKFKPILTLLDAGYVNREPDSLGENAGWEGLLRSLCSPLVLVMVPQLQGSGSGGSFPGHPGALSIPCRI